MKLMKFDVKLSVVCIHCYIGQRGGKLKGLERVQGESERGVIWGIERGIYNNMGVGRWENRGRGYYVGNKKRGA